MSTVRLLSPSLDLIDEVVMAVRAAAGEGTNDLSGTLVVFPGKRPAHVLRKRIADILGTAYRPPTVVSVDLFIDLLYRKHCGGTGTLLSEADAVALLFELHKAMPTADRVGGDHFDALETFYPVGTKIVTELEELTIAGVSPDQLRMAVTGVTLSSAHALAALNVPFYRAVAERGAVTRAQTYAAVASRIETLDISGYRSVILAGFFAFTQTEETIVRHLLSLKNVRFLFQEGEGIAQTLESFGLRAEVEGDVTEPQHTYYESPDAHGQLSALNRILQERYPQIDPDSRRAAIILPSSENLFPLYHQTLSAFPQDSYNLALGYPMSRTPVYGFLMSALGVAASARAGEVFIPDYLKFLLHPYTKNVLFATRTDVTRMLVHGIEEECLRHSARVFRSLEAFESDPHLFAAVVKRAEREGVVVTPESLQAHLRMIHDAAIRPFLSIRTVGGLADACIGVLQFINERSTAHKHPYFRPFVESLLDNLVALRGSLLAPALFTRAERFVLFLRQFVATADVPFSGTPLQGLQILGFLETRGLRFRDVFMIDVNDDVLPGTVQQDVLLPLTIREQLGLSTYRDQERIKAYVFDVLRRGAERIHLFFINNAEKERSRFIAQLQWKEQQEQRSLRPQSSFGQTYAVDLGTSSPEPVAKSDAVLDLINELPLSSTALDAYLTCGLQFYYKFILRLHERGEVSGDVERSDVGKIVHAILQEFFITAKDRPLVLEDLSTERLERIVEAQFRSAYGAGQFGEQFFAKRQVERHLLEFLEEYQRPQIGAGSVTIEALEQKFETEIDGILFTGNADRIETRGESTYIIDYKTAHQENSYIVRFDALKGDERETWKQAIGSLQLTLYVMLYSSIKNIPPERIVPAFIFLGKKDLAEGIEVPLFESAEQMQQWFPELRRIVLALTAEIRSTEIPFTPTADPKSDCPECPYRAICGTQWTEKSKNF